MTTRNYICENKKQTVVSRKRRKLLVKKTPEICDGINNRQKEMNNATVKKVSEEKLTPINLNQNAFFRNSDDTLLLYAALDNDDTDMIDLLIDQGADLNVVIEDRMPFIFDIITKYGEKYYEDEYLGLPYRYDVVKRSIKAGVDVGITWRGYSLLSRSLMDFDDDMAELFINAGADINPPCPGRDCVGCSPLSVAIEYRFTKVIDLLLIKGVDVNSKTCKGTRLPLNEAICNGDIEMASRLINLGADVNAIDGNNGSSLNFALRKYSIQSGISAEFLLRNTFVDVNIQDEMYKKTALHWITSINEGILDSLLNANPDMNIVDKMGELVIENYNIIFYDYKRTTRKEKIKNHLIKLRAIGFYLIDRNIAAISGEECEEFYAKCCQEVDSMKETKISPASHINFHDVLFMTYEKLALCLESLDDQGILQFNFQKKFPSYAGMIEFKFERAHHWIELREKLSDAIYRLFDNYLPSTIMEKIFNYFNIPELMKL